MYVCICNGVTERDIRTAVANGCASMTGLTMRTGCGACCGSCVPTACELIDDELRQQHARAEAEGLRYPLIPHAA